MGDVGTPGPLVRTQCVVKHQVTIDFRITAQMPEQKYLGLFEHRAACRIPERFFSSSHLFHAATCASDAPLRGQVLDLLRERRVLRQLFVRRALSTFYGPTA